MYLQIDPTERVNYTIGLWFCDENEAQSANSRDKIMRVVGQFLPLESWITSALPRFIFEIL